MNKLDVLINLFEYDSVNEDGCIHFGLTPEDRDTVVKALRAMKETCSKNGEFLTHQENTLKDCTYGDKGVMEAFEALKAALSEYKDLSEMGNDYHQQGCIDGNRDLASAGVTKMERARYELGAACQKIFTSGFLRTIEQALLAKQPDMERLKRVEEALVFEEEGYIGPWTGAVKQALTDIRAMMEGKDEPH